MIELKKIAELALNNNHSITLCGPRLILKHFNLFLTIYWPNWNQTWYKCYLSSRQNFRRFVFHSEFNIQVAARANFPFWFA